MRFAQRPPRDTFADAGWVSHVKIDARELLDESQREGLSDLRHVVTHLDVFKKPDTLNELPSAIYGSSMCGFTLEEGKEYLLSGSVLEDGRLSCVGGQIRPEDAQGMVAEWNEITESFKEEMRGFS